MPFRLVIHNVGNVASIGNAIFLAGERRLASPNSTFWFHGVSQTLPAGYELDEAALRERLDDVLADQRRIGRIIAERTELDTVDIGALFAQAQTKDADWALSIGMVHEVSELELVAGAPVLSV